MRYSDEFFSENFNAEKYSLELTNAISDKRIKKVSIQAIKKCEDTEIIRCIDEKVRSSQIIKIEKNCFLDAISINKGCSIIEKHGSKADKIIVHPYQYADIKMMSEFKKGWFFKLKRLLFNTHGNIFGIKIYISHRIKEGSAYILAAPNFIGLLPIDCNIKKQRYNNESDKVEHKVKGWIFYERIGIGILNDWNIVKIEINK